ncbi:MAG TPA: thiamine pyrophosphate-dependent enzyme [Dehalococcoidales bacterium]|nr:thiamine pyrophosphate-dependent enzyme [Dehalococcoidales bacterium]
MKIKDIPKDEFITSSLSCAGCGAMLAVRLALKALGRRTVIIIPAGCMSAVTCFLPQIPFRVPMFVSPFAATAAILQGVSAGFKWRGVKDINVLGIAGDGATADIGMAAFSQAIVSGMRFIYLCVENEAYMNTGIQSSSTTPVGAATTTDPLPDALQGTSVSKKDIFSIAVAHRLPYAATASVSYPLDYYEKVLKAAGTDGPSFIHVLTPCPPGWRFPTGETIEMGRMAVKSGMWHLLEYSGGKVKFTYVPKERIPVSEYIKAQARFRTMSPDGVAHLQSMVDERLAALSGEEK